MVEVSSDLDHALNEAKGENISQHIRTEMVQEEYVLFGIVISATKIRPHDQPVQFEASIGEQNKITILFLWRRMVQVNMLDLFLW